MTGMTHCEIIHITGWSGATRELVADIATDIIVILWLPHNNHTELRIYNQSRINELLEQLLAQSA